MVKEFVCPNCGSSNLRKSGTQWILKRDKSGNPLIVNGVKVRVKKQRYICKDCGTPSVNPKEVE